MSFGSSGILTLVRSCRRSLFASLFFQVVSFFVDIIVDQKLGKDESICNFPLVLFAFNTNETGSSQIHPFSQRIKSAFN